MFGHLARARIAELKGQQAAVARPLDKPRQDVAANRPNPWNSPAEPVVQQKSGLDALSDRLGIPRVPIFGVPASPCDAIEVPLGTGGAVCVNPGSGVPFRDCPTCPEMVAVPAGSFMMGSPDSEKDRANDEGPQRRVTIAKPLAVGKFEVTFDEWDACVAAVRNGSNAGFKAQMIATAFRPEPPNATGQPQYHRPSRNRDVPPWHVYAAHLLAASAMRARCHDGERD